jgi:nucleotide-binding universal stress UspA family protein
MAPSAPPEAAQKMVEDAAKKVKTSQFVTAVETKVIIGNPKTMVYKLAAEIGADLLVVGSRKPDIAKMLFGSTSHALMLAAPCSVRIARGVKEKAVPTVLIGFDGSEFCYRAIDVMCERKWPKGTRFVILNAVPTIADAAYDNPHIFSDEELEKGRARLLSIAQQEVEQAQKRMQAKLSDVSIEARIVNGHPREALIAAVSAYDADRIVVGTQGRNFSAHIAIGSVSEAVAVGASCTVEIVKTPIGT